MTIRKFNIPEEGTKDNGSNTDIVNSAVAGPAPVNVTPENGNGDERSEPEEHSQKLNGSDGELVGGARETGGRQSEVCDCEESPYRCEEHEVQAVRRPTGPWVGVEADDYRMLVEAMRMSIVSVRTVSCQAKHNDGEDCLRSTNAENDSWCNHFGYLFGLLVKMLQES
jgi:hypothetical protein